VRGWVKRRAKQLLKSVLQKEQAVVSETYNYLRVLDQLAEPWI
jgi:hypothetical protein